MVAFRKHTLLPLDDCLYGLQATIPHLTRSSLHRVCNGTASAGCRRSKAINPPNSRSSATPIGYFHIDIAEVRTEEGKLHLFVAIDRTSKSLLLNCTKTAKRQNRCWLPRSP